MIVFCLKDDVYIRQFYMIASFAQIGFYSIRTWKFYLRQTKPTHFNLNLKLKKINPHFNTIQEKGSTVISLISILFFILKNERNYIYLLMFNYMYILEKKCTRLFLKNQVNPRELNPNLCFKFKINLPLNINLT